MFSPRRYVLTAFMAVAAFALVACGDAEGDGEGSDTGIDREQLLGEVSEVRSLFEERSPLPPELIADVSYEEGQLDVTLAEDAESAAGDQAEQAEQAEQVCSDLSEAIQLPDLSITVHGPDGTELASCEFGQ